MPLVIALALVAAFAIAMLVFVGYERGPTPADVAVAYQTALVSHDYSTLFDLSAPELRGTKRRSKFVSQRRTDPVGSIDANKSGQAVPKVLDVSLVEGVATVRLLANDDQAEATIRVSCMMRNGRWQVTHFGNDESGT